MSNLGIKAPSFEKKPVASHVSALSGSYVTWARHIAQKEKLRVVFGGSPATDGKTMQIPELPYDLNEEDLKLVRSDIMHESGHCTDTDFAYFTEFGKKHGSFAQSLLNSIEDVRIEVRRSITYPGATALIRDTNIIMMNRGKCRTGQVDAADALTTMAYMQGCVLRGWNDEHERALNQARSFLSQHLGQAADQAIEEAVQLLKGGFVRLKNTQDAGDLTLAVMKVFSDAQEQLSQDSESSGEGEKGDPNQTESGESSQGKGDQGETSDDQNQGSDDGSKGEEGNPDQSKGDDADQDNASQGDSSGEQGQGSDSDSSDNEGSADNSEGNDSSQETGDQGSSSGDQDQGEDDGSKSGDGESEGQGDQSDSASDDSGNSSNQDSGSEETKGGGSGDSSGETSDGTETQGQSDKESGTSGEAAESQGNTSGDQQSGSSGQPQPGTDKNAPKDGKSSAEKISQMLGADPGSDEVIDYRKAVEDLSEAIAKGEKPEYDDKALVPEHSADFRKEEGEAKDQNKSSGQQGGDTSVGGCEWAPKNRAQYLALEAGVARSAGVILGRLQSILRMATKARKSTSNKGRLNTRKLYRVPLGDDRVFKQTKQKVLPKAAVTVLTDLSGSMLRGFHGEKDKGRLDTALQAQILLAKAMETIRNPTEFAGFGGRSQATLTFAKTFDQSALVARDRIGGMAACAGGGTPLLEGLMHASVRLAGREESKKVMFIITDGAPKQAMDCGELIARTRASGIQVISILVEMDSTPAYLEGHPVVHIDTIDDLPTQLLGLIQNEVLGG